MLRPSPKFKSVLFDMDGTLIDSEPVWQRAIRESFDAIDIAIPPELEAQCAGLATDEGVRLVLSYFPDHQADAEALIATITRYVGFSLGQTPHTIPGADALLRELYSYAVPMALVSASPRELIDSVLAGQGWGSLFQLTLSSEEVGPGKPDPAVYIEAAHRLGVAPSEGLVVEDTMAGVKAGRRAGLHVVAIPSYEHEHDEIAKAAEATFSTLVEATPWILSLFRQA